MAFLSDDVLRNLRSITDLPDLPPDRYELLDKVGAGGMGAVYRAKDLVLDREVAVKVLSLPRLSDMERERMLTEARVLAQLEHPGIVPVHDAGVLSDGRVFYTMKLVRGPRLDAYVRGVSSPAPSFAVGEGATETAAGSRGELEAASVNEWPDASASPASLPERVRLFARICEAVAFAHAHGVIHRDLKPANVMVGAFGEVLVLDWGAAKVRSDVLSTREGARVSQDSQGVILGTPGFMAPEQERGDADAIDERTDVFALGAILGFLLQEEPPRRLVAISKKANAADPGDRYANVSALITDLERYQEGRTISAYRDSIWERCERFAARYRVFILLILAYLAMRVALLLYQRRD